MSKTQVAATTAAWKSFKAFDDASEQYLSGKLSSDQMTRAQKKFTIKMSSVSKSMRNAEQAKRRKHWTLSLVSKGKQI